MAKTTQKELQRRKRNRRKVLPGFPWKGQFQTKAEVDVYFAGEKVQCLLCGKWYKEISNHLQVHEITVDEYKKRFGLPWSKGLGSEKSKNRRQRRAYKKMEEGCIPYITDDSLRPKGQYHSKHTDQPFAKKLKTERALQVHGQSRKWEMQDYETILDRMRAQQRTLGDVCKDEDVPSIVCWNRFVKTHPDLMERAQAVHNTLPYAIQTKTRIFPMSPQFREDCQTLHHQGLTYGQIGKRLGVSPTAVRYALIGGKPEKNKKST